MSEREDDEELSLLFSVAARKLANSDDPVKFLDWIADAGAALAPKMAAMVDPRAGPIGNAFRMFGVAIYNAMPLPQAGYRPRRIPEPGRNDPCSCGSGIKYKHCCLPAKGLLDFSAYNMLRHMLDQLPKKYFPELVGSHVELIALADVAEQWRDEGDEQRAIALLEPWFKGGSPIGEKLEPLFDALMDCYLESGNPGKRQRLIAQVLQRGDRIMRAAALQRRATMEADKGDLEAAWSSFTAAQREDPDNIALAGLEITLLTSHGEKDRARERARFWIARLQRQRDPQLADMIAWLQTVSEDPDTAMAASAESRFPELGRLRTMLATLPAPLAGYEVQAHEEAGRVLIAGKKLARIEPRWGAVFPQIEPELTMVGHGEDIMWVDASVWLDFLEKNPQAWSSFNVIDDVVMAVDAVSVMGLSALVVVPLLERAAVLVDLNLASAVPGNGTLQWGWLENRPALRLLARRAFQLLDAATASGDYTRFVEAANQLLGLNPNDNHFLREPLMRAWLELDQPEKVLALAERYPDDFCGPTLNRVLALFRVGRRGEAISLLKERANTLSTAIDMLLANNPKPPREESEFGLLVGGKEEAWNYRSAHLGLWEQDGAIDWLRTVWKTLRPKNKRRPRSG